MARRGTEAFPELGAHCDKPDCNQLDFLPFDCDGCGKVFCAAHRTYRDHGCAKAADQGRTVVVCPDCGDAIERTAAHGQKSDREILEAHARSRRGCDPARPGSAGPGAPRGGARSSSPSPTARTARDAAGRCGSSTGSPPTTTAPPPRAPRRERRRRPGGPAGSAAAARRRKAAAAGLCRRPSAASGSFEACLPGPAACHSVTLQPGLRRRKNCASRWDADHAVNLFHTTPCVLLISFMYESLLE